MVRRGKVDTTGHCGLYAELCHELQGGPTGGTIAVFQVSFAGEESVNPYVEIDFPDNEIETREYQVDYKGADKVLVSVGNADMENWCDLAVGIGGSIVVTVAENTSAVDGGSLTFGAVSIPLYYPTMTPYGDLSDDPEYDYEICPME